MIFCCFPIGIPLNHWISRLPAFKVKTFLTSLPLSLFLIDETFRCFFWGGRNHETPLRHICYKEGEDVWYLKEKFMKIEIN